LSVPLTLLECVSRHVDNINETTAGSFGSFNIYTFSMKPNNVYINYVYRIYSNMISEEFCR